MLFPSVTKPMLGHLSSINQNLSIMKITPAMTGILGMKIEKEGIQELKKPAPPRWPPTQGFIPQKPYLQHVWDRMSLRAPPLTLTTVPVASIFSLPGGGAQNQGRPWGQRSLVPGSPWRLTQPLRNLLGPWLRKEGGSPSHSTSDLWNLPISIFYRLGLGGQLSQLLQ